ncbi:pyridoxamine 5'-phosphate oxidase family protein [Streptomyces sp. SID13031]|uniref:pyridoxamine 5'-phosphate oxidase family protein n=1 Tax=Streptomyces sp. SID13031 TaxID=2706046 RepID=UPI0013C95166|nr:pyridoxamine 5'-phosphate oxidase family protein [Streptomyces sp. SID13031]NEA33293.1 pyridoxamine 5'-phosphate oxidase family protein [Streptomyces sp. SID13031]
MTTTTPLSPTDRTKLRREKERAAIDRAALAEVLLAGMFCHLGVVIDGAPLVLPTAYGVDLDEGADGTLYLHGSVAARSVVASPGQTICVTVTHADGLVLARSAFHHSVNYRSAVIFGLPRLVTDPDEKLHGLNRIVDHLVPGRSTAVRPPSRKELAKTSVLALDLTEASVKTRAGAANDDEEDLDLPYWTGVIPLRVVAEEPITNPDCTLAIPTHIRNRADQLSAAVVTG